MMPSEDGGSAGRTDRPPPAQEAAVHNRYWPTFTTPQTIKRIFDQFPLQIYPANRLPLRAPRNRDVTKLYVFTTSADAARGAPSFNPSCLKWQAFLKLNGIAFRVVPSSNHSSPSGNLPFLLPSSEHSTSSTTSLQKDASPVTATKIESWVSSLEKAEKKAASTTLSSHKAASLLSLLDHPIRIAYLYALYLDESAFATIASPLYLASSTNSSLIKTALGIPLRNAALAEVMLSSSTSSDFGANPRLNGGLIMAAADEALESLSTVLGTSQYYNDGKNEEHDSPGLLDAAVFAYIHVILQYFGLAKETSAARNLVNLVEKRQNLVEHRARMLREFFYDKD